MGVPNPKKSNGSSSGDILNREQIGTLISCNLGKKKCGKAQKKAKTQKPSSK